MLIKINGEDVDIPEGSLNIRSKHLREVFSLNWKFLKNHNL